MTKLGKVAVGAAAALASLGIGTNAYAATKVGTAFGPHVARPVGQPALRLQELRRILRDRAVEAEVVLRSNHGYVEATLARGMVSAISSTSITVDVPNGTQLSATIGPRTRFRPAGSLPTPNSRVVLIVVDGVARLIDSLRPPTHSGPAKGSSA